MRTEEGKLKYKQSQAQYDKEHTMRFGCKLNTKTDADIIAWLEQYPNRQGYIKQLIREDIARNQHSQK